MTPIDFRQIERSGRIKSSGRLGTAWIAALAILFSAFAHGAVASEPEIIRVQVPEKQTSKWFPPGTELRVMPADEFESLVKKAKAGSGRQKAREAPRLIRARHQARWASGVLTGQTELIIASDPSGPVEFVLDAWSPAVVGATRSAVGALPGELPANPFVGLEGTHRQLPGVAGDHGFASVLGARDSGKTSVWVDCHPVQRVCVDWLLQPRRKSRGNSFNLALPGEETTILSLEIPKDWIPSIRLGRRRGPFQGRSCSNTVGKSRLSRVESSSSSMIPIEGDLSSAVSKLWVSALLRSTCAVRSIDREGSSTGRPTGCSSSIRAIPGRSRWNLIPGSS